MGLLQEIEEYFCSKNLYEVFGVEKDANQSTIKKAYRNLSLKHHPDKFQNSDAKIIEIQTAKFQLLAKIHKILSDDEKRSLYDEQGIILDDESMDNADWVAYWRLLFPKITENDINNYLNKYIGSQEEIDDLKKIYVKCKGDMNLIYEHMIGYEEDRIRKLLNELIDSNELEAMPKFVNESKASITKRKRKIQKEKEECEADQKKNGKNSDDDLVKAIMMNNARRGDTFNSLIANLEAKYASGGNKKQKTSKKK
jgi:DnaJ family protein C protein 9